MQLMHAQLRSFPSRLRSEADAESLKTTGDVELQKLKVMPQTVFLKSRMESRSPRAVLPHRRISDIAGAGLPSSPRLSSRRNSVDAGSCAPFEDLRRRLATINGTTNTLSAAPRSPLPRYASTTSAAPSSVLLHITDVPDFTPPIERPGSPTDSVVSTANSSAFRAMHRLQVGPGEVSKAAPAVGSSKANATGLFEQAGTIRSENSPERASELVSPLSTRPRELSLMPVSSYGKYNPLFF
jgi:phosphoinositide-3-kinase regulatory subunit 4